MLFNFRHSLTLSETTMFRKHTTHAVRKVPYGTSLFFEVYRLTWSYDTLHYTLFIPLLIIAITITI